ncbi:hypothetical protein ACFQZI_16625 [Mucilaginibacter lutimaris]|uniref:Uncharacterized protein n=1 Tax=Mucilaginibacter lutimaris TaxID=931629 RepID=A0ABW2ZJR6_9SPHI
MKKLLLLGCIPLLLAACKGKTNKDAPDSNAESTASATAKVSTTRTALPTLITLNGILLNDADRLVMDFISNSSIYKSPTNIWFSKNYLTKLKQLLEKEGADGIRIYFAKFNNGHNIILASTRKTGERDTHRDYFEHTDPFLQTAEAKGVVDYTGKYGATLYDPNMKCPDDDNCNISYNHYLKCSEAGERVRNFTNDKIATTSEWFDIGLLSHLMNELETNAVADGIRIYYARKIDADKTHGFVIVTTRPSAANKNIHEDYYTCSSPIIRVDNGEQCPTNCNGVTWPPQP